MGKKFIQIPPRGLQVQIDIIFKALEGCIAPYIRSICLLSYQRPLPNLLYSTSHIPLASLSLQPFFFLHKTPETKDPDIIPARGIHGRRNPAGRSPGGLIGCYLGQSKHNHILCDQRCKLPTLTAQGAVSPTKEALTLPRYETIYKIHLDNYTCVPKIRHILWVTQLIP